MAIVTNTFTEPGERAKAIGMWGSAFGLSVALGPVIGGALVGQILIIMLLVTVSYAIIEGPRTASLVASGDEMITARAA